MQTHIQQQRAFAGAQTMHDLASPPCIPDHFLDTPEGSDWIDQAVRELLAGDALVIKSRSVMAGVTQEQLLEAVALHLEANPPTTFALERILVVIAARGRKDGELYSLLLEMLGLSTTRPDECAKWSVIHDLAEGLISPLADAHCRASRENDEEDGPW